MSGCEGCRGNLPKEDSRIKNAEYTIALAGNANVGKSATFNQLTGVDQIIGNWPGKTVERAEGLLLHKGKRIRVIDLPGIYSFSTYSMEELVSRDFIALEHPDAVINVIDASALERNLFFTIQLMELAPPMMIAVNQVDLAEKKGITVDTTKLSALLGVPVIPTIAIRGKGIDNLSDGILNIVKDHPTPPVITYGKEVEERITRIISLSSNIDTPYPVRWTAIKLLEGDPYILRMVEDQDTSLVELAGKLSHEIEAMNGEPRCVVMSAERYQVADRIAAEVITIRAPEDGVPDKNMTDRIDRIVLHPVFGYISVIAIIGGLLVWTFIIGAHISGFLTQYLSHFGQY